MRSVENTAIGTPAALYQLVPIALPVPQYTVQTANYSRSILDANLFNHLILYSFRPLLPNFYFSHYKSKDDGKEKTPAQGYISIHSSS